MDRIDLTKPPLGEEHLDTINYGLMAAKVAKERIKLAESAGIDMSAEKAKLLQDEARLLALKQTYFPHK